MPRRTAEIDGSRHQAVWLEGQRRYVYVLTILGVFTRSVLHWSVGYSIKQEQVQEAWQQVIEEHLEPAGALAWELHIEVRNDNGPQFSAKKLRQFLRNNYFVETFTHPYTPQENGHIESFHSIVTKALRGQYFENLAGITAWLACFYRNYNYERIHGNTLNLPPLHFCRDFVPAGFDVAHRSFVGISFSARKPVGIADIVESIEPLPTPIGVAVRFAHIVTFKNGEIKTLEEVAGKVYCFFEIAQ